MMISEKGVASGSAAFLSHTSNVSSPLFVAITYVVPSRARTRVSNKPIITLSAWIHLQRMRLCHRGL